MIYCRECKRMMKIKEYNHDDPVLSCGHIKERRLEDDLVNDIVEKIQSQFREEARKSNITVEQIQKEFADCIYELYSQK